MLLDTITPRDLKQLSYDDDVESRTVSNINGNWIKEYGAFPEGHFDTLNASEVPWTVLVQEVDRHIPRVADLWQKYFSFVPTWRRDDIMISYAPSNGGIGAHVDAYDVFLIQGRGTREWSIENKFISAEEEVARKVRNADTKLIRDFKRDQSWVLRTGDMLVLFRF